MPRARWASTKPARPRSWPDAVRLAALACALAFAPLAARADFAGRVVGVVDGDTLTILDGSRQVRVRLWGIDAPERGQPWSSRSREALAARAMHREARVAARGTDGYGRTLARVVVDGVDLGDAQLADGLAWVYRRYSHDRAMLALEEGARAARRGLWSLTDPEPPWEWRARGAPARTAVPRAKAPADASPAP